MEDADSWVNRFHIGSVSATASGIVDVAPGTSWPARVLGRLLRLPPAAAGQPARLRIVRRTDGDSTHERWIRTFGAVGLTTRVTRTGEQVVERAGPLEIKMRCRATACGVWFVPAGAGVVLGRLGFRLPGLVAPRAYAHAWPSGEGAFDVEVSLRIPLLGALLSYRGHFTEAEQ